MGTRSHNGIGAHLSTISPLEQLCHYARTRHFGVQEVAHEVDRVGERTAQVRHAVVVGIYSPDAEKGDDCDDCD